jgi:signal transduction histidine kinase
VSARRRAFERIGGPDAVTWPAFWITLVAAIAGHLATAGPVSASVPVRILVVITTQLLSFAVLLLLRWTLLRNPARPRPWVAVGGFAVAAIVRGIALSALLVAIGAVDEPRWLYRIAAALLNQMVLLIVVALVVSSLRAHTRSLAALIGVQHDLAETQARIVDEVTSRNEDLLAQVQERLRSELTALEAVQGVESVAELQRLASDVVRPMSHELAQSVPAPEALPPFVNEARIRWQQVAAQMVDRPPLRPMLAAGFICLLLLTAAAGVTGSKGIPVAIAVFVSVLVWSSVANMILARALTRSSPRTAIALVIIASLVIGFLSTGAGSLLLASAAESALFFVGGGLFTAVIVLLVALVSAILREQQRSELELAESTENLRRALVRLRQARWLQQKALARALHGPMQSAVTSAALRLELAVRAGEPEGDLVADIRNDLRSVVDVLDVDDLAAPSLDLALERITGTWEGICEVTSDISDAARAALEGDPIASAVFVDLMTEAISNAVRHSDAEHADLVISEDGDGLVTLVVCNDVHAEQPVPTHGGLGTNLLEECTLEWSRASTPPRYVLTIVIPTAGSEPTRGAQHAG